MSAPTGRRGLTPGDCLKVLSQLNTHRKHNRTLGGLPPRSAADLHDTLDAIRAWMAEIRVSDVLVDGAMNRLDTVLDCGEFCTVQEKDLKTVKQFLMTVLPTQRPTA